MDEEEVFFDGEGRVREIAWEAPEHHHFEKSTDWYWAMGIIAIASAVTMIIFGNALFGIAILLAGAATALISSRPPRMVPYAVNLRGIRVGDRLYPYSTIRCFFLDEEHPRNIQLLVESKHHFTPLMVIPVPDDVVDEVEYILESKLPEEHLEEPLGHKLLEFLGF
jgi:hypothetical protein